MPARATTTRSGRRTPCVPWAASRRWAARRAGWRRPWPGSSAHSVRRIGAVLSDRHASGQAPRSTGAERSHLRPPVCSPTSNAPTRGASALASVQGRDGVPDPRAARGAQRARRGRAWAGQAARGARRAAAACERAGERGAAGAGAVGRGRAGAARSRRCRCTSRGCARRSAIRTWWRRRRRATGCACGPGELDAERFERGVEAGRGALDAGPRRAGGGAAARGAWRCGAGRRWPIWRSSRSRRRRSRGWRSSGWPRSRRAWRPTSPRAAARWWASCAQLVAEHPTRERLAAQLMLALYRSGRQAEALEAYRDARERLVEDAGVEPGPELRRLQERVLRQDRRWSSRRRRELPRELDRRTAPPLVGRDARAGPAARALGGRRGSARAGWSRCAAPTGMGKTPARRPSWPARSIAPARARVAACRCAAARRPRRRPRSATRRATLRRRRRSLVGSTTPTALAAAALAGAARRGARAARRCWCS